MVMHAGSGVSLPRSTAASDETLPTAEAVWHALNGFMATQYVIVAAAIGLFEALAAGPLTLDALSSRLAIPRRTLRIVADAMVALGFLRSDGGAYDNAPVAAAFLSGRPGVDLRPALRFTRLRYQLWTALEESVRSGAPADRGTLSAAERELFSAGVEAATAGQARALARIYDFRRHRRVLDLGGGTGSFLITLLGRYRELQGTLFEQPATAALAQQRLAADRSSAQLTVVAGDLFGDALPADHDAVLLANVMHLFSPDRNVELLRRVRGVVAAGTRALLVDFWTDVSHQSPASAAMLAGEFLLMTGDGDIYSAEEASGWLSAAGWRVVEHRPLVAASSVIVGEAC